MTTSKSIISNICEDKRKNNSIQNNKFYFDRELYKERYVIESNNK